MFTELRNPHQESTTTQHKVAKPFDPSSCPCDDTSLILGNATSTSLALREVGAQLPWAQRQVITGILAALGVGSESIMTCAS